MKEHAPPKPTRRIFLKQIASVAGVAPNVARGGVVATLAGCANAEIRPGKPPASCPPTTGSATPPTATALPPTTYESLGPVEAAFVEKMVDVMCPADALTPRGVDCGLAIFIDRQLARDFGKGARRYAHGPWKKGIPQAGNQLPMTPEQFFKVGLAAVTAESQRRFGGRFDQLDDERADALLDDIAAGKVADPRVPLDAWFNELVYPLFVQACFADPMYGGNRNKAFWKMIGYPGLPAKYAHEMVEYRGKPFPGAAAPRSIADFG
jgi:gluconate 2-dehydrogenase gamma chain